MFFYSDASQVAARTYYMQGTNLILNMCPFVGDDALKSTRNRSYPAPSMRLACCVFEGCYSMQGRTGIAMARAETIYYLENNSASQVTLCWIRSSQRKLNQEQ
jgi:hypothetical protein